MKAFLNTVFIIVQYIVPQHLLSRAAGYLAGVKLAWIKNPLIRGFIRQYKVDMSEAVYPDAEDYPNFNAFFTRALKEGMRPIAEDSKALACPADGAVSQLGAIDGGRIFQAKGQSFSCRELLGGRDSDAAQFENGQFATIYLSPKDYHRVHMPCDGKLVSMTYIPGDLFSVNQTTAENVDRLFSRNERVVCSFDTEFGPMAMVLVGAMIVGSVDTVWAGQVAPPAKTIRHTDYLSGPGEVIELKKGEEMGRFKLGSTVILLLPQGAAEWAEELAAESPLRMGQAIAQLR